MNILLLGSGGREAALAWKIRKSPLTEKLYIAPGNGGTRLYGENVEIDPLDFDEIREFVKANDIELLVVGNEDPLVAGIRDYFADTDLPIVGPGREGAMLEGSKVFAKDFMKRHNIPTARYKSFTRDNITEGYRFLETLNSPYVLKADGLAAGKGVIICDELGEAKKVLDEMLDGKFGNASSTVVIEEFLTGIECSVFVLTDGKGRYLLLPEAKDYKRIDEGDKGPNTGGMGAVSPVIFADESFMRKVIDRIIEPTVKGLKEDGIDYRGFIFFGLINVGGEPMVIEYNCRMGDPETEAVMPRIDGDLVNAMVAAAKGDLSGTELCVSPMACTAVIAVSEGYPGSYKKGYEITLPEHTPEGVEIFQAGTKLQGDKLVTSGGRVLAVSSLSHDIEDALSKCYDVLKHINYQGITFRKDIGRDLMSLKR